MLAEKYRQAKEFLIGRRQAYNLVFDPKNQFANVVLKDLARFCRANDSTYKADPREHAVLEGRREVWLRISRHLHMDAKDFLKLYGVNDD